MSQNSAIHELYVYENVSVGCVSEKTLCYILYKYIAFLYCESVGEMQDVRFLKKLYYICHTCKVSHQCGCDNVIWGHLSTRISYYIHHKHMFSLPYESNDVWQDSHFWWNIYYTGHICMVSLQNGCDSVLWGHPFSRNSSYICHSYMASLQNGCARALWGPQYVSKFYHRVRKNNVSLPYLISNTCTILLQSSYSSCTLISKYCLGSHCC